MIQYRGQPGFPSLLQIKLQAQGIGSSHAVSIKFRFTQNNYSVNILIIYFTQSVEYILVTQDKSEIKVNSKFRVFFTCIMSKRPVYSK